jgi:hypothetical protein
MSNELMTAIDAYIKHIKTDYTQWQAIDNSGTDPVRDQIRKDMIQRFVDNVRIDAGSKYAKIVANNSVHSFIVLKEGKFPVGSILKAASWAAPATNFARGNVLSGDFSRVTWTGAA